MKLIFKRKLTKTPKKQGSTSYYQHVKTSEGDKLRVRKDDGWLCDILYQYDPLHDKKGMVFDYVDGVIKEITDPKFINMVHYKVILPMTEIGNSVYPLIVHEVARHMELYNGRPVTSIVTIYDILDTNIHNKIDPKKRSYKGRKKSRRVTTTREITVRREGNDIKHTSQPSHNTTVDNGHSKVFNNTTDDETDFMEWVWNGITDHKEEIAGAGAVGVLGYYIWKRFYKEDKNDT